MALIDENPQSQPSIAGRGVLLIGAEAARIATHPYMGAIPFASCATLLEAVFAAGKLSERTLIIASVGAEVDHLEAGIRSLRRVNRGSRVVLLCEPIDEAICRRAIGWGADDYFILPLEDATLKAIFEDADSHVVRRDSNEAQAGEVSATTESAVLEQLGDTRHALPLAIQTALLEEVFEGAGVKADFASRAAASLKRSLKLKGGLTFIADESDITARGTGEIRRRVAFAGQLPFGILLLESDTISRREIAAVEQAAAWLAAMLAVSRRYEQLRTMAITDELSGAYNRRYFVPKLTAILNEARENGNSATLMLFDIDDFKKYNDQFGHASGDAIIRELIKILHACTRPYDLVARIGGDEFAVVYRDNEAPRQPNSQHPQDVRVATERFREAIRNHQWPETCHIKGTISISGGLATFPRDGENLDQLFAKADEALLKAKASGKNVIVLTEKQNAAV